MKRIFIIAILLLAALSVSALASQMTTTAAVRNTGGDRLDVDYYVSDDGNHYVALSIWDSRYTQPAAVLLDYEQASEVLSYLRTASRQRGGSSAVVGCVGDLVITVGSTGFVGISKRISDDWVKSYICQGDDADTVWNGLAHAQTLLGQAR